MLKNVLKSIINRIQPKTITEQIYPEPNGPRVDMWDMNRDKQVFGYWEDGSKAGVDCPPTIKLELPIKSNGNFPGNPSKSKFFKFLGKCRENSALLNREAYNQEFGL